MTEIDRILVKLKGTHEAEVLQQMADSYRHIAEEQESWLNKSGFTCVEGCGECCRNFEPDLLESEALYMAAWLLENKPELAESVSCGEFSFPREKGCQFWNEKNSYHCTIYGGRPSVCRLFGASSFRGKDGKAAWKVCKFYPAEKLKLFNPLLTHRQYNQAEAEKLFGEVPPVMRDLEEQIIEANAGSLETKLIREILPQTIKKIMWLEQMCGYNSER